MDIRREQADWQVRGDPEYSRQSSARGGKHQKSAKSGPEKAVGNEKIEAKLWEWAQIDKY